MLYQLSYYRFGVAKIKKCYKFEKIIAPGQKKIFMPLTSSIVLAAFSILGLALILKGALLKNKGLSVGGFPTIQPFYFLLGKSFAVHLLGFVHEQGTAAFAWLYSDTCMAAMDSNRHPVYWLHLYDCRIL